MDLLNMQHSIVSLDLIHSNSVRPVQGLRFGNFDGTKHLPPVKGQGSTGSLSLWALNNQQIYRTICDWVETWQPWQQKILLNSILNRCSLHQLELLATSLEPLRHRDYMVVSRHRYPSASLKTAHISKYDSISKKSQVLKLPQISILHDQDSRTGLLVQDYVKDGKLKKTAREIESVTTKNSEEGTEIITQKYKSISFIAQAVERKTKKRISDKSEISSLTEKPTLTLDQYASLLSSAVLFTALSEAIVQEQAALHEVTELSVCQKQSENAENKTSLPISDEISVSPNQSENAESKTCLPISDELSVSPIQSENTESKTGLPVSDELSVSPIQSENTESKTGLSISDELSVSPIQSENTESETGLPMSDCVIPKVGDRNLEKCFTLHLSHKENTPQVHSSTEDTVSSSNLPSLQQKDAGILLKVLPLSTQKERPLEGQEVTHSHFLGGSISFTPQSQRGGGSSAEQKSASSHYRYSTFSSSGASTLDFFLKDKISVLGPMQRKIRLGPVQRPVGLGNIPVPLQQSYKNKKWWSKDSPQGTRFEKAKKQDLSNNFRDQLSRIFQWLQEWESHEVLGLLKETAKLCRPDVLESVVVNIQQKLRDAYDVNRLSDKLLLYVFSFLPPTTILNCAKVCRRWRYLCAMDDVWIIKCLELGEMEGIENIPQLIETASESCMGVDWMLAYKELDRLVKIKKKAEAALKSTSDEISTVTRTLSRVGEDKIGKTKGGISKTKDGISTTKHPREDIRTGHIVFKGDKFGSSETWTDTSSERETTDDESEAFSEVSENDLHPFTGETQMENLAESSKSQKTTEESKCKSAITEEVDPVFNILTDLSQSKDLLGRIVPAMTLEWQSDQPKDDAKHQSVYAGKVLSIRRVRKLQGHIGGILCLQFDLRRLITGGADHIVHLWDVRSGRSVHKFFGHKGCVRCLKFDDDILVTGSWDSLILVWNIRRFTQMAVLYGHMNSVSCLHLSKSYIISGSHDHTVRVWARPTFMCMLVIKDHKGPVTSLVANDTHIFSTSADLSIRMTDLVTGTCTRVFEQANECEILCLVMHGHLMIGGDSEGRVYFWNTENGMAEAAVKVHEAAINCVAYNNGRFYTGSSDGTFTEYDLLTMTCLRVLRGHKAPVRGLQVSDRRFVSCAEDGIVSIWDLQIEKVK